VRLSYAAVMSIVGRGRSGWDSVPRPINIALVVNCDATDSTALTEADQVVTREPVGDDTGPRDGQRAYARRLTDVE
jgi:hypothetical protein